MDKRKRRLIIIIEIIVLLFVAMIDYGVFKYKNRPIAVYDYENYQVVIKSNTYCKASHCGRIDMEIRQQGGETEKLFDTTDDRLHDGGHMVVDKEDNIQMCGENYLYVNEAYETAYKDGVQAISIYYINKLFAMDMSEMRMTFVDKKSGKEKFNEILEPDKKDDMLMFKNGNQAVFVTEKGIMIDPGAGSDLNQSIAMMTGIMDVKWEHKSREVAIRMYAETAGYCSPGIIKPKVRWVQVGSTTANKCYAVELDDWDKIEEIHIGNYVFKKYAEK